MNEKRYKLRFLQLFEDDLNNTILQKSACQKQGGPIEGH